MIIKPSIQKGQRFKFSTEKIYQACEDSYRHPHGDHEIVKYQIINPLTDRPWQAERWAAVAECQLLFSPKKPLTVEDIQQAIYDDGSIGFLRKVHDALVGVAKHDPLSAHLASELEEVILYQDPPISETIDDFMFSHARSVLLT
jgi:hypothetical protein